MNLACELRDSDANESHGAAISDIENSARQRRQAETLGGKPSAVALDSADVATNCTGDDDVGSVEMAAASCKGDTDFVSVAPSPIALEVTCLPLVECERGPSDAQRDDLKPRVPPIHSVKLRTPRRFTHVNPQVAPITPRCVMAPASSPDDAIWLEVGGSLPSSACWREASQDINTEFLRDLVQARALEGIPTECAEELVEKDIIISNNDSHHPAASSCRPSSHEDRPRCDASETACVTAVGSRSSVDTDVPPSRESSREMSGNDGANMDVRARAHQLGENDVDSQRRSSQPDCPADASTAEAVVQAGSQQKLDHSHHRLPKLEMQNRRFSEDSEQESEWEFMDTESRSNKACCHDPLLDYIHNHQPQPRPVFHMGEGDPLPEYEEFAGVPVLCTPWQAQTIWEEERPDSARAGADPEDGCMGGPPRRGRKSRGVVCDSQPEDPFDLPFGMSFGLCKPEVPKQRQGGFVEASDAAPREPGFGDVSQLWAAVKARFGA